MPTHYAGTTWEATDGSKVVGDRSEGKSMPPRPGAVHGAAQSDNAEGTGHVARGKSSKRVDTEASGPAAGLR